MRYMAILSYDGWAYNGWQRQPDAPSVQAEVERVLSKILDTPIEVYASGRTDRGVHARGQVIHFDTDKPFDIKKLQYGFNAIVNKDIYLYKLKRVTSEFHARYDVVSKVYSYVINNGEYSPFERQYCMQIRDELNMTAMKEAAQRFIGSHNFKDFTVKEEDKDDFVRTIYAIKFSRRTNLLRIDISGTGFMTYMVRLIVGTLIAIGQGREDASFIDRHLDTAIRDVISYKAEPQGLFLMKVNYK